MIDTALIEQCADSALEPAIVAQFIEVAGSPDPLAVTVQSGGRLILVPKAKTEDEALEIARQYVGKAVVRVGLTQLPAGVGAKDASELKRDLVEPCGNLRMGTAMFAKVLRIVTKWYGNPKSDEVFPQLFEDAVHAWRTGSFEGENVFQAEDPGGQLIVQPSKLDDGDASTVSDPPVAAVTASETKDRDAGIRIDLSRIGNN